MGEYYAKRCQSKLQAGRRVVPFTTHEKCTLLSSILLISYCQDGAWQCRSQAWQ